MPHASARHPVDEVGQHGFGVLVIHADPALDRHRHRAFGDHRGDAIGHQRRPLHQHRAKAARLHAVGRAADVQVDLVIAPVAGNAHGLRQFRRVGPAQLQRDRVFGIAVVEQPRTRAVDHGGGGDHLGIQHRTPRHLAMEEPAMAIRPVHHGRNRQATRLMCHRFPVFPICPGRPARLADHADTRTTRRRRIIRFRIRSPRKGDRATSGGAHPATTHSRYPRHRETTQHRAAHRPTPAPAVMPAPAG